MHPTHLHNLFRRGLALVAAALALAACGPRQGAAVTPTPATVDGGSGAPTLTPPAAPATPAEPGAATAAPLPGGQGGADGEPRRISFAAGASSAAVEGAVIRGERDRYVLRAAAGQAMSLQLTTVEQNGALVLSGPDGRSLAGAAPGDDASAWSGLLPADGDYLIEVGPTRGNATYRLTVSITTPQAPGGGLRTTNWVTALLSEPALEVGQQEGRLYVAVGAADPPVGGLPVIDAAVYGDFDGDGREDAAIPLASGGTAGNVGVLVFRDTGAGPGLAGWRDGYKLAAAAEGGLLVLSQPIYAPWEPNCCPSGLAVTSYTLGSGGLEPVANRSEGRPEAHPDVVRAFYDMIRRKDLAAAYALLAAEEQAANPYEPWAAGFADTLDLAVVAERDPAGPNLVAVELTTTDRSADGGQTTRRYAGTWEVRWDEARPGWSLANPLIEAAP